ncbi:MAG: mannitol dehydrogenase family protein, partial [Planctomycetota bacterium]
MPKKLMQFGAGNIGRSFIGQVFSRGGYEVVFVDVAEELVNGLNREGQYRSVVKQSGREDEIMTITNIRAVNGRDAAAVVEELLTADLVCTSVGKGALPFVLPVIADGLQARQEKGNETPLDIIFAENIRNVASFAREELAKKLPADFPLDTRVGLVETSIGKMVPIMKAEDLAEDPLWVFAEAYNTLILDAKGFRNGVPDVPSIKAVQNIQAYVDRKLFIHNLGHATTSYLGFQADPSFICLWEALAVPAVEEGVRAAMTQAAVALNREYPDDLPMSELEEHIEDLIGRFQNKALGDTIFRVGRDLKRKLHREDRLVGAILLAAKHALPFDAIADSVRAAAAFAAFG